jgi:hypothetical protein
MEHRKDSYSAAERVLAAELIDGNDIMREKE